jgi:hypothetical protein
MPKLEVIYENNDYIVVNVGLISKSPYEAVTVETQVFNHLKA